MKADALLVLVVAPSAWILRRLRESGIERFPKCRAALIRIGVFPIRDHYYEPDFNLANPVKPYSESRNLPGVNLNTEGQLSFLAELKYAEELKAMQLEAGGAGSYELSNRFFEHGDTEYWYQVIRMTKPGRIIEIGSGQSTLVAMMALKQNRKEGHTCEHICIEPYETPWLESSEVTVLREKVEDVGAGFFEQLESGDILFIDSSHIIRPEGDVLFEFLELLPRLRSGVIVHVHDIFTPRNYPEEWLVERVRFWNEQYLLEAFLSGNQGWEVIGALNYLYHDYTEQLKAVCPYLSPENEPKSFYLKKR